MAPHPYAIRTPDGSFYPKDLASAKIILMDAISKHSKYSIDVGACQINLGWNGHRAIHPTDLLDLQYNVDVAANILRASLKSRKEFVMGIGHYNAGNKQKARRYGERVLALYKLLKKGIKS